MDARIRGMGPSVHTGIADRVATASRRPALDRGPQFDLEVPPQLAELRIALVHDWLTGMRGGEKCLEVLCRRWPTAQLFTLLHRAGSVSEAIETLPRNTSFLH